MGWYSVSYAFLWHIGQISIKNAAYKKYAWIKLKAAANYAFEPRLYWIW